jgi:hypothetical protein
VPSICCRHDKKLVSVLGSRVNCQRRNYLPNDVHEVDAKERKKKNDDEKEGREKGKARRVISIFLVFGMLVVSIGRFDQFAFASWKGRPRNRLALFPSRPGRVPQVGNDSRERMRRAEPLVGEVHCQGQVELSVRACFATSALLLAVTSAGHWHAGDNVWVRERERETHTLAHNCTLLLPQADGPADGPETIPILTFSGSQIDSFLAQGRGPCLQPKPPFHQSWQSPFAKSRAKNASGCHVYGRR